MRQVETKQGLAHVVREDLGLGDNEVLSGLRLLFRTPAVSLDGFGILDVAADLQPAVGRTLRHQPVQIFDPARGEDEVLEPLAGSSDWRSRQWAPFPQCPEPVADLLVADSRAYGDF